MKSGERRAESGRKKKAGAAAVVVLVAGLLLLKGRRAAVRTMTLAWECDPVYTNAVYVADERRMYYLRTGLVRTTNLAAPVWVEVVNMAYARSNRATVPMDLPCGYFRAWNGWRTNQ